MPVFWPSWPSSGQRTMIDRHHHVITVWQHGASVVRFSHVMTSRGNDYHDENCHREETEIAQIIVSNSYY